MTGGTERPVLTALVTGAARRVGRAIALALARQGMNVLIHDRSADDADALRLADEIRAMGVNAWTVGADLADRRQVAALMAQAVERAGSVDVLVNNASVFPEDRLTDFELERFDSHIQVNSLAPLVLVRDLAAGGRRGAVVNLLDTRIVGHDSAHASYLLSKRLLHELTRMLALELAPRVRVNAVAPGLILPPRGKDEGYLQQKVHQNPLRRYGDLQGVTDAVLFLVRSEFVTGQIIFVDGGQHLHAPLLG